MSTYILWDVDGTLLRNGKEAANLYHEAIELAAGRALPVAFPQMHGKTDGQVLAETLAAHGLDADLHATARHHLDELSRLRHERGLHREICPGVPEAIAAFAARGWTNGLLTGNGENRARYKIDGAGLPLDDFDWEHSYFGDVSPLRSDLTLAAVADHPGAALVIVGDTPADDAAARVAGIPFVGVATGVYTVEDLRETGGIAVVDDLASGLDAVLAAIEALGLVVLLLHRPGERPLVPSREHRLRDPQPRVDEPPAGARRARERPDREPDRSIVGALEQPCLFAGLGMPGKGSVPDPLRSGSSTTYTTRTGAAKRSGPMGISRLAVSPGRRKGVPSGPKRASPDESTVAGATGVPVLSKPTGV